MIYLGTSGFSFQDWVGTVYPEGIKPSQMLKYYWAVLGFNAVEINFTYYSMPSYRTMVSMLRKTPPDFKFAVKVPGHLTHEGWRSGYDSSVTEKYLSAVEPLISEGRFLIHLAQFPYSFKFSKNGLKYIKLLSQDIKPLAVEFRHRSWDRKETYELLKDEGITYVVVDEPQIAELYPYRVLATTDVGYFRFHGRNENWFEAGDLRYDYLYNEEDLKRFADDIRSLASRVRDVLVFFNNCHKGKAAKNALRMKELLGV